MAKGYWIGHITLTDPEKYEEDKTANAIAFSKFGGRFGLNMTVDDAQTAIPRDAARCMRVPCRLA